MKKYAIYALYAILFGSFMYWVANPVQTRLEGSLFYSTLAITFGLWIVGGFLNKFDIIKDNKVYYFIILPIFILFLVIGVNNIFVDKTKIAVKKGLITSIPISRGGVCIHVHAPNDPYTFCIRSHDNWSLPKEKKGDTLIIVQAKGLWGIPVYWSVPHTSKL